MLSKKFFTGLCLILSTNGFCQNYDNHFKNYAKSTGKEIREFRAVKDLAFSDDYIYAINGRATYVDGASTFSESSHQEPMFFHSKTNQNFEFNHIGTNNSPVGTLGTDNLAASKKAKYSTIEADTYVDNTNNEKEILFVGTSNDEVRKYDGSVWRTETESEVGLPTTFSSNVMAKYEVEPNNETYCLLGLNGVPDGSATLYKTPMNNDDQAGWWSYKLYELGTTEIAFKFPVVDLVVSEHTDNAGLRFFYAAVNDGGLNTTVANYYTPQEQTALANAGLALNQPVNGVWVFKNLGNGLFFTKLDLEKLSTVEK